MKSIQLAIASTTSKPGELDHNLQQIIGFAERASGDGADLLLTPELSATGYGNYPEVLALGEVAGAGRIYDSLATAARRGNLVICAGFVELCDDKNYLSHYAIFPDGQFVVQRKNRVMPTETPLLPAVPLVAVQNQPRHEHAEYSAPQLQVFEVQGVRCAIVICADAGICGIDELLRERGVQVALCPTGAGGTRDECVSTEELSTPEGRVRYGSILETLFYPAGAAQSCLQLRRALAAVNLCGFDGRLHYHRGHGSITNAMGETVGFFPGQPNIDRQKPMYAHAIIDVEDCL